MWKKHNYTNKRINKAGETIINPTATEEERREALKIVDEFRAAHAFPANTFAINLKKKVAHIPSAVVVQRLKRLDTITHKLERFPDMKLSRMQDLGGCRVIVPKISDVYDVVNGLRESRIRHIEHNFKDYIKNPNPETGYRGYHLIYKYNSDRNSDYNGLLVEIQIRTEFQHIWATAVETVGLFTDNGLKFNLGSDEWLRFFKLTSALISIKEKSFVVEGVPNDELSLFEEWISLLNDLNVIGTLAAIGLATKKIGHIVKSKSKNMKGYYLIILDLVNAAVDVRSYSGVEKGLEQATKDYNEIEENNPDLDCVLVSAQSYESLVKAYPNYFLDVNKFIGIVSEMFKKYKSVVASIAKSIK